MVLGIIIKLMKHKYRLFYQKVLVVKSFDKYLYCFLNISKYIDLYIKLIEFIKTFLMLFGELLALFIVVSFIVSFIQQVVSEEKIKQFLNRPNKAVNYVLGTFFGAVTPFCSCSTIPILAGLLNSKVPFGPSMSFLIASPLMNPVMIFM